MSATHFTKGGGNVGTPGSVSFMFDQKGQIIIDKEECEMDPDELMMLALDAGVEISPEEEDSYEVITAPEDFSLQSARRWRRLASDDGSRRYRFRRTG